MQWKITCNGKLFLFYLLCIICKTGSQFKNGTLVEILINPKHVLTSTKKWVLQYCLSLIVFKGRSEKKIPLIPKSKSTYPTVVSDTTAHQKPSGDPIVNEGEN